MELRNVPSARARQRGASLLFALMALVLLAFAAVALTRSVDTGTLIMGNLSFKQDTLQTSNTGTEEALNWLSGALNSATLEADAVASGYYASTPSRLDATGNKTSASDKWTLVNWDGACQGVPSTSYTDCSIVPKVGTAVNGNEVRFAIIRLCTSPGPAAGTNVCLRPAVTSTSTSSERGELQPGGRISTAAASPYYQILVRVAGPRNTVSYTETMVHF